MGRKEREGGVSDAERYALLARAASELDEVDEVLAEGIRGYLDGLGRRIPRAESAAALERLSAAGFGDK